MSSDMEKGQKKYLSFIKKQKKAGKTHAEANALWKEQKTSTKKQSTSAAVPKKSKPKKKSRESGFGRPKGLWKKLNHSPSFKSRVNIEVIKKTYVK